MSVIRKLSSGKYEAPPADFPGSSHSLVISLSEIRILRILFQRSCCAFIISIPEEASIQPISRVVAPVIFFIWSRVLFLYSGIIKKRNFGGTFCIASEISHDFDIFGR